MSTRDFLWLPPAGLRGLLDLLSAVEGDACWPRQVLVTLVALQVRGENSDRAVGLLAWLVRFGGRFRNSDRASWSRGRAGSWGAAIAGSSALRIDLFWLYRDKEAANSRLPDHQSGSLPWDVPGFYGALRWGLSISRALDLSFPL